MSPTPGMEDCVQPEGIQAPKNGASLLQSVCLIYFILFLCDTFDSFSIFF